MCMADYPQTNAGVSLTAGHYRDLNWTGDGMEEVVSDEEVPYLADWSPCAERRGAVRMRHRGKCADGVLVNSEFSVICDRRGVHGGDSGVTTVFAYVTDGIEVCDDISYLNPSRNDIFIEQAGVWPLWTDQPLNSCQCFTLRAITKITMFWQMKILFRFLNTDVLLSFFSGAAKYCDGFQSQFLL